MKVSVNTQSSIKIESDYIIYFDPYKISENANDADLIFITHSHYDHFSKEDIYKVMNDSTKFICPLSIKEDILNIDISEDKILFVNPNNNYEINNYKFKTVPAYNINKEFHKKEYNWCGYIINIENNEIYVAGDTDAVKEFETINCDLAFVPIGGKFTMNAKEAANLINKITPKEVIPIHYGSIIGTKEDESIFIQNVRNDIKVIIKL